MEEFFMEFVEIQVHKGNYKVLLKQTGEVLDSFMNRWDAVRVARSVEKALRSVFLFHSSSPTQCM